MPAERGSHAPEGAAPGPPARERPKLVISLPLGKIGCALAIVLSIWGVWHFGVRRYGERFRIGRQFEGAFVGRLEQTRASLEAMRGEVCRANRDLLELRIRQVEVMGVAIEGMTAIMVAGSGRGASTQDQDIEAVVWRSVAPVGAGDTSPVRIREMDVDKQKLARLYTLTVENGWNRPLDLDAKHFFRCHVTVQFDRRTGALLQRTATVSEVANLKSNTLIGVEVPPGGSAQGVLGFFASMVPLGPAVRDSSGSREEVRVVSMVALVFTDGELCAAVRDTTE